MGVPCDGHITRGGGRCVVGSWRNECSGVGSGFGSVVKMADLSCDGHSMRREGRCLCFVGRS